MMTTTALVALVCGATPPVVPAQFSSNVMQYTPFSVGEWVSGQLVYDRVNNRTKLSTEQEFGLGPAAWDGTPSAWSNWTQWTISNGTYFSSGAQIREFASSESYVDMFGWVPQTTYAGTAVVNNVTAQVWEIRSSKSILQYLATAEGVPVQQVVNITAPQLPGQPVTWQNTTINFVTFEPIARPSDFTDLNVTAALFPPRCPPPQNPTPIELDMYIFHPANEFNISGQDTADAIGDAAFVCFDVLIHNNTKNDNYSVVSLYTVEVYPQFGQYQPCNGYHPPYCVGAEPILVGREGGLAYGPGNAQGQCTPNPLTGSWYNLPPLGQCANGSRPTSPDVCTWRIVNKIKTIDQKCLTQRGMFDACKSDGRLPFPKSTKVFVTAFEQDDPSMGGCPPISE